MRIPTCRPSVFASGMHLIVGPSFVSDAILAMHLLAYEHQKHLGISPSLFNFDVRNRICSISVGFFIDVGAMWANYRDRCVFTPDAFEAPHFVWRVDVTGKSRARVLTVFRKGKICITGGVEFAAVQSIMEEFIPLVRQFKVDHLPSIPNEASTKSEAEQFEKFLKEYNLTLDVEGTRDMNVLDLGGGIDDASTAMWYELCSTRHSLTYV